MKIRPRNVQAPARLAPEHAACIGLARRSL